MRMATTIQAQNVLVNVPNDATYTNVVVPTTEDDNLDYDDGIPRHLRLLMVGDSVTRYQYLSLVYYLRHGKWEPIDITIDHPHHIINEHEYGTWNEFFFETNDVLAPYEWCDCYRPEVSALGDIIEARYYHDPRYDNYVYFISKFGPESIHGVWEPETLSLSIPPRDDPQEQLRNNSVPVLPNWEYTWSNLGDLIARLQRGSSSLVPPTHVVLNGGLWSTDVEIRDENSQDALIEGLRDANVTIIYKTTTAERNNSALEEEQVVVDDSVAHAHGNYSRSFSIHDHRQQQQPQQQQQEEQQLLPLQPYEERLCSMADHCLDLSWTVNVPPKYYWDNLHFYEPVYRWMNYDLLTIVTGTARNNIPPPLQLLLE
jgi:hypothetical protein